MEEELTSTKLVTKSRLLFVGVSVGAVALIVGVGTLVNSSEESEVRETENKLAELLDQQNDASIHLMAAIDSAREVNSECPERSLTIEVCEDLDATLTSAEEFYELVATYTPDESKVDEEIDLIGSRVDALYVAASQLDSKRNVALESFAEKDLDSARATLSNIMSEGDALVSTSRSTVDNTVWQVLDDQVRVDASASIDELQALLDDARGFDGDNVAEIEAKVEEIRVAITELEERIAVVEESHLLWLDEEARRAAEEQQEQMTVDPAPVPTPEPADPTPQPDPQQGPTEDPETTPDPTEDPETTPDPTTTVPAEPDPTDGGEAEPSADQDPPSGEPGDDTGTGGDN